MKKNEASGISRLDNGLNIYSATASGGLFIGNQFVKTLPIAKTAKILGVTALGASVVLDTYAFANGQMSGTHYTTNLVMDGLSLTPFVIVTIPYFLIDNFYPGGYEAAAKNAAPVFNAVNQPTNSFYTP